MRKRDRARKDYSFNSGKVVRYGWKRERERKKLKCGIIWRSKKKQKESDEERITRLFIYVKWNDGILIFYMCVSINTHSAHSERFALQNAEYIYILQKLDKTDEGHIYIYIRNML